MVGDAIDLRGDGHAVLRQGRTVAGDPGRPRGAGLQVLQVSRYSGGTTDGELLAHRHRFFSALADAVCTTASAAAAHQPAAEGGIEPVHPLQPGTSAAGNRGRRRPMQALAVVEGGRRIESTLSLSGQLDADCALLCRRARSADRRPASGAGRRLVAAARHGLQYRSASQRQAAGCWRVDCHGLRRRARARSGRLLCRRPGGSRFRRQPWPAQLARGRQFPFRLVPVSVGRQGGEDRICRHRLGQRRRSPSAWPEPRVGCLCWPSTPRVLNAGTYRAYFTPAAMGELLGTLAWSGLGTRAAAHRHVEPDATGRGKQGRQRAAA